MIPHINLFTSLHSTVMPLTPTKLVPLDFPSAGKPVGLYVLLVEQ